MDQSKRQTVYVVKIIYGHQRAYLVRGDVLLRDDLPREMDFTAVVYGAYATPEEAIASYRATLERDLEEARKKVSDLEAQLAQEVLR